MLGGASEGDTCGPVSSEELPLMFLVASGPSVWVGLIWFGHNLPFLGLLWLCQEQFPGPQDQPNIPVAFPKLMLWRT